jgi:alpha-glucosidase
MTAGPGEQRYELPHHDGSAMYVPEPPTRLGDSFDVLLRVPLASTLTRAAVRQVHDGEPVAVAMREDGQRRGARWMRATLRQVNPVMRYRFLTDHGPDGYRWITAAGPMGHDPSDAGDFVSSIHPGGPDWLPGAVAYQIFPDRFARSGRVAEPVPDWAAPAAWEDEPVGRGKAGAVQFYGGDLYGIADRLGWIESLGANLLYLTPVFPARSAHRYDATSFDRIDPLLGGDEAYRQLIAAAHARGMRVLGDFTTNHTGIGHDWFRAAAADIESPSFPYYSFRSHPHEYDSWLGHRGLPKLNYAHEAVLEQVVTGPDAPLRRYLRPEFGLDGWRIDVANMTGRNGALDVNQAVARAVRAAVAAERPDAYLVGEHFHDFTTDLPGDGWQGVMNYAGFTKPIWSWLSRGGLPADDWMGIPWPGWPNRPGPAVVASMEAFAAVPWQHRAASMSIVSSHDSPRIRSVTGSADLVEVAVAAMFTMPGVPMVWSGDEIGLTGEFGEGGRKPFPWYRPEGWDRRTLELYRRLAGLRRTSRALQEGSLRWLAVADDRIVYLRESGEEQVLVQLLRAPGPELVLPSGALGLQDGAESARLYATADVRVHGGLIRLPGGEPGAGIWRWAA